MADFVGKPKSLIFTAGGSPLTIGLLQSALMPPGMKQTLEATMEGTSAIATHYQGEKTAYIEVTTFDFANIVGLDEGDRCTAVTLEFEAAVDSGGTAQTTKVFKGILSHAVIETLGDASKDNANKAPTPQTIRFLLSRAPGSDTDPTFTVTLADPA